MKVDPDFHVISPPMVCTGDKGSPPLEPRDCQQPGPKAQHGVLPPLRCQPFDPPARCPDGRRYPPWERTTPPSWDSVLDAAAQNVSPGGSPLWADSRARFWAPDDATLVGGVGSTGFVDVPGGEVVIGVDTDPASSFVWDLEGPPQVWHPCKKLISIPARVLSHLLMVYA
jgi:hypothetical protein